MSSRPQGRHHENFTVLTKLRPIEVEIRFDRKNGTFFAWLAGERLESAALTGLRDALTARGREIEAQSFTFRPYIEFKLVESSQRALLGLEFRTIELSDAAPGEPRLVRPVRKQLDITDPHFPEDQVKTLRYFPAAGTRVVPYSHDRLRVFEEISDTIIRLRDRLREYLNVPDDTVGDAVDWLTVSRLFPRLFPPETKGPSQ